MAVLVFGFLSVLVCISGIVGEPQCSPFHYHEQLLERMIDVKYRMDALTEKMDKWETIVSGKVEKMDALTEKMDKWETIVSGKVEKMDALTEKMDKWETIVSEKLKKMDGLFKISKHLEIRINEELESQQYYLNNTMAEFVRSSAQWKQNVEDKLKTTPVLFKARSVKNSTPSKGDTVIFQTIVQNQGSGYSTTTGIFTAPVGGTYLFHTQFNTYAAYDVSVNIVASGKVVTAANFGDKDWPYKSSSTEGVATLEQGDEVMVRVTFASGSPIIYPDSSERYWSYFSGIILNI